MKVRGFFVQPGPAYHVWLEMENETDCENAMWIIHSEHLILQDSKSNTASCLYAPMSYQERRYRIECRALDEKRPIRVGESIHIFVLLQPRKDKKS